VTPDGLRASEEKMRQAGVPDAAIDTFRHYYEELASGASGLVAEEEIEPVESVPSLDELPHDVAEGGKALDHTVAIKLNGGLGTSMGMTEAKSLLPVKDGLSFLDVIARQTLELRRTHDARLPLVLMNSFYTREASLAALARYPELESDVPADFVQNKEPKITVEDLQPVSWPADPDLEWCPPGHGDLYTALVTSGMLDALRDRGYRYAFVSNSDNLDAVLEPRILGWLAAEEIPFLMEVADRTPADRKGGHLARRRDDGQLVLRELAQTPDEDAEAFQDVARHRFFNTNTLWVDLHALADVLAARDNVLGLPMIVNRKTVDPGDSSSPPVYQLETAMGAAISVFEGARALRVSRDRFAPVKTTNDLLGLRSDCYVLTEDARLVVSPLRTRGPLFVDLDPDHYKRLADFDARFPAGPPSLVECDRFVVRGDVRFGAGVVARGDVEVVARDGQAEVPDGRVLEGRVELAPA
jgi:UTP--glucose-1-phosphate uridylyltransferase